MASPWPIWQWHPLILLLRDLIAAPDILNIVKCTIPSDVESALLSTVLLCRADTAGNAATAWCRIGVFGSSKSKSWKDGGEEDELHDW